MRGSGSSDAGLDGSGPATIASRRKTALLHLLQLLLPLAMIVAALLVHTMWPDIEPGETGYYPALLEICAVAYAAFLVASAFVGKLRQGLLHLSWYIAMLFFLLLCYDIATGKTGSLDALMTVPVEDIASSIPNNAEHVLSAAIASLLLLLEGIAWGMVSGALSGLIMGWSYYGNYWISPVLRIIGPVPSVVWLPIAMILMPSTHAASVFVISLAVWFPVTLNVGSAMRRTPRKYLEAASCLGASGRDLLLKVAVPNALPAFFTGMFMGLSASFGALVFAEMLGVETGLGWYLMAARNQLAYGRVLSTVILFMIVFSLLVWLLFRVRRAALKWQGDLLRQ